MKKIPTLFQRNYDGDYLVRDEVTPGCEWVLAGEGVATEKFDGTCCLWKDGKLWKRFEHKPKLRRGQKYNPRHAYRWKVWPAGFVACQEERDSNTGSLPGWVPVGYGPQDRWHREALSNGAPLEEDQTYELVGPKVQGNPYGLTYHQMWQHGLQLRGGDPRCFKTIQDYLRRTIEGIVWHHPDGRRAKIKRRDFGLEWPIVPLLTDAEADA